MKMMLAMKEETLALFLILLVTSTVASPGFKLRLTNAGVQYANSVVRSELYQGLRAMRVPNLSGTEDSLTWELNNIQTRNAYGPDTELDLSPHTRGLSLRVYNFGVDLRADWRAQTSFLFNLNINGSVDANFDSLSVMANIRVGEMNSRPYIHFTSCNFRIGRLRFQFRGAGFWSWILNLFRGHVEDYFRDIMQRKACGLVTKEVADDANIILGMVKASVDIGAKFQLDYGLVGHPIVTGNYLEYYHKGIVYWKEAILPSPVAPPVFPPLTDVSKMLYIFLTDYSFNTFAYEANRNKFFDFQINDHNVRPELRQLLNANLQFPGLFPDNSRLAFNITCTQAPTVTTRNGQLSLSAEGTVDVLLKNGSNTGFIMTLAANATIKVEPSINNGRLNGAIRQGSDLTFALIQSFIGIINENKKDQLDYILTQMVSRQVLTRLDNVARQGLDLPITGTARFIDPQIILRQGAMIVATDVEVF